MTYGQLRTRVQDVVGQMQAQGFRRNDRIAVAMPSGPATAALIIALMAGFTAVPLNPQLRKPEFVALFSRTGIRAVVVEKGAKTDAVSAAAGMNIPVIELVPDTATAGMFSLSLPVSPGSQETAFAGPGDTALLVLTSGTTALPRIVPYSQDLLCRVVFRYRDLMHYDTSDRTLQIVPYFHLLGILANILLPLSTGSVQICTRDFIPGDFVRLLSSARPTRYWGVPALHQAILSELRKVPPEQRGGARLRVIGTVSAAMPDPVRQEIERLLSATMIEVYGMSEAALISFNVPYRAGSVGIPRIEYLAIEDEHGEPVPSGRPGEIVVRGELVFGGYEDAPEENTAAFRDGWFRTGDVGYLDMDGYLFITGRVREMINKGGEKISPQELDTVLLSHPGIRDAMAFAVHDPALGEDIGVMVVREDPMLTEAAIRAFLIDRVSPSRMPRNIVFADTIPKTQNGKPLRDAATRMYS